MECMSFTLWLREWCLAYDARCDLHELLPLLIWFLFRLPTEKPLTLSSLQVGRTTLDSREQLVLEDFSHVEKMSFPATGSNKPGFITPPHSLVHTFKFKSYSLQVFRRIRNFFGIDNAEYMMSVCGEWFKKIAVHFIPQYIMSVIMWIFYPIPIAGNYNFLEFISNSKSGQFFFYSHDGKYMIKTQTKEENKFMKRVLPHYYKFVTENPHTMLVRILGTQIVQERWRHMIREMMW